MDKQKVRGFWSTVRLNKKQICFLGDVAKNCRFSGGKKFSKTAIIRALLSMTKKLRTDVSEVKTEEELKERFLDVFARHK